MYTFTTLPFDLVHNPQYEFHKVVINGQCLIDDFINHINERGNKKEKSALASIISNMDMLTDRTMLPKEKFRPIKNMGRDDVFEFKKDSLRIYIIKQRPNVFVILGGYKTKQDKDINKLARLVADFQR